jgi:hypothetical protein
MDLVNQIYDMKLDVLWWKADVLKYYLPWSSLLTGCALAITVPFYVSGSSLQKD